MSRAFSLLIYRGDEGMHGNLVYLRILEKSDLEKTTRWINSDYISDIMGYLPVKSIEQQYGWYESLKNDANRYIFAICLNDDGRHIGNIGLGNIDHINRHAMFSIFIADKMDQGKGYGTQAAQLLLKFAFNRLNMNKIYLRTSQRFNGAIIMYERLGFVKEGVMRQHYYTDGKYEDKIMYSILKNEFKPTGQNQ